MDKTTLQTLKDRVKAILEVSITSRNSDASLVCNYWYKHDTALLTSYHNIFKTIEKGQDIAEIVLPLNNYESVTQPSVIERARRLVQEEAVMSGNIKEMGKYLPTELKILKARRINCKIWKDVINDNKIEFILQF